MELIQPLQVVVGTGGDEDLVLHGWLVFAVSSSVYHYVECTLLFFLFFFFFLFAIFRAASVAYGSS